MTTSIHYGKKKRPAESESLRGSLCRSPAGFSRIVVFSQELCPEDFVAHIFELELHKVAFLEVDVVGARACVYFFTIEWTAFVHYQNVPTRALVDVILVGHSKICSHCFSPTMLRRSTS